mmetsp:Transcript_35882/g.82374  ORF Transcript_35882/g.82374 Transcript_35882/m.82374 type:complete len:311 (-) Transcript_35882:152-1084(-)
MSRRSLLPLLILHGCRVALGTRPVHDMEQNELLEAPEGGYDQDIQLAVDDLQVVEGVEEALDLMPPISNEGERVFAHRTLTEHLAEEGNEKLPPAFFQLADERVVERHTVEHYENEQTPIGPSPQLHPPASLLDIEEAVESLPSLVANYTVDGSSNASALESRLEEWRDYLIDQVATQVRRVSSFKTYWASEGAQSAAEATTELEPRRQRPEHAGSPVTLLFTMALRHWVVLLPIMVVGVILVAIPGTCMRHGREQEEKVKEEMVKKAKARLNFFETTLHSRWLHPWGRGPATDRQAAWVQHGVAGRRGG